MAKILTEKEQVLKRLFESKAITFEELLLFIETPQYYQPITIPYQSTPDLINYPGTITYSS